MHVHQIESGYSAADGEITQDVLATKAFGSFYIDQSIII